MPLKQTSPTLATVPPLTGIAGRWAAVRDVVSHQGRQLEVGNLATLGVGEVVCRVATLVAFVHLARTLTPSGYGQIELTLAILMILTLVVDQGLGTFGTREVAREPRLVGSYTSRVILLQLAAAMVVLLVTALVCLFSPLDRTLKILLIGYSASLLGFPFHLQWLFQGLRQMRRAALPQVLRWGSFTALVFVLVRQSNDILMIPLSEIIAVIAGAALFLFYLTRVKSQPGAGSGPLSIVNLIKESLPIGGSNLIWAMRMYLPTVLVGIMTTQSIVGYFGTAHRVLMAFQTFVNVYFMNLLPLVTDKMHRSQGQVGGIIRRSTILTGSACLLMALVVTASARPLIRLIFGEVYARSQSPVLLSVVIWVIPVFVLRNHARSVLIAMGCQRIEMICSLIGLIGLVGVGGLATAFYGARGTAWTMIGSEVLATSLSWAAVKYYWNPGHGSLI
jgi:PST family polysaccharide transporter